MALWNWKIKDSKEPITERNIVVLYTFGKKNESLAFEWFIKIHILLELQGEEIITTMIVVKKAIEEHNSKLIQISL